MADYIDIDYSEALHEAAEETRKYIQELLDADDEITQSEGHIGGDNEEDEIESLISRVSSRI